MLGNSERSLAKNDELKNGSSAFCRKPYSVFFIGLYSFAVHWNIIMKDSLQKEKNRAIKINNKSMPFPSNIIKK